MIMAETGNIPEASATSEYQQKYVFEKTVAYTINYSFQNIFFLTYQNLLAFDRI